LAAVTWKTLARTAALLFAAASATLLSAAPAFAGGSYSNGAYGTDISWPQCGRGYDTIPANDFTVVGVNGGEPFTMNPCFGNQYGYMRASGFQSPSLYINLQYGEADNGYSGCGAGDHACRAHDYGYLAAQYAYTQANFITRGDTLAHTSTWWLDVETMNTWSDDSNLNAQVVRGALEFLTSTGKRVGVYSTPGQWGQIAGGYNPGHSIGNWVAGADSTEDAGMCQDALWAGGEVWIFQYLNYDLDIDQNRSC
jgi:hypothetical protein